MCNKKKKYLIINSQMPFPFTLTFAFLNFVLVNNSTLNAK